MTTGSKSNSISPEDEAVDVSTMRSFMKSRAQLVTLRTDIDAATPLQAFIVDENDALPVRDSSISLRENGSAIIAPIYSLTLLQHETPLETLLRISHRVEELEHNELIQRYESLFNRGKRVATGIMAAELIRREIPPCFWHTTLALDGIDITQRADLVLSDLAWLRRWHSDHAKAVRYRRGKLLFDGSDTEFLREARFAFYEGKRPAWKLVQSLSLTESQQWECAHLRSAPISRRQVETIGLRERVFLALRDDIDRVRRTATFNEVDARKTLERRCALWQCARMVRSGSPTEIAYRYEQLTGIAITRQTVGKQLEKMRLTQLGIDMTLHINDKMTRGQGVPFSNQRLD